MEKVSCILTVRSGSKRIENKNTRIFAGFDGGLLELKLRQLCKCKNLFEIVLSTNDPIAMSIGKRFGGLINIVQRDESLCRDNIGYGNNDHDNLAHALEICHGDHIMLAFTTSPIADEKVYDEAILKYSENLQRGYDSLMTVRKFTNFLCDQTGRMISHDERIKRWPQTQSLPVMYEVNDVAYICSKEVSKKKTDRIGYTPALMVMDDIQSVNVDYPDDFFIAEAIYEKMQKERDAMSTSMSTL